MCSKRGLSREEIDALLDLSSDSGDNSEADDWEQLLTDIGTSSSSGDESEDSEPVRANGASTSSGAAKDPSRTSTVRKDSTAWIADKDNDWAGKPPDFLVVNARIVWRWEKGVEHLMDQLEFRSRDAKALIFRGEAAQSSKRRGRPSNDSPTAPIKKSVQPCAPGKEARWRAPFPKEGRTKVCQPQSKPCLPQQDKCFQSFHST
ncbi:hypothetical protein HPB48_004055 [Haemaphysalis longicornis]|uniref:Uncharacterized protein n=1 Tax=Haemaphysalis longicornis TaxID=44386 RepID=A0A9J6FZF7_HAELO|nr:hypothetical protein HPB48_004055 [Haemaphysalis longicornis]